MSDIRPVGRNIIVRPTTPATTPRRRPPAEGIVEEIGGSLQWMEDPICRPGDRVYYPRLLGAIVSGADGKDRVLISADDILAVATQDK